jgi:hypothetical protein
VVRRQRHAPAALPPGKTRYPLYRRLGGPQGRSGEVRKISPPPGFDPRTVQPVGTTRSNIQKFYVLPTQCFYVFCMDLRTSTEYFYIRSSWLVFITETVSVYCAVRTGSLNIIRVNLSFYRVNNPSQLTDWFLGAFGKSRKATISFVTSVCLSVCLSACLPACLPACLSVCLSACLSVCLSVSLSVCQPVWLSVCLSACLSVSLSVCLPVCTTVRLSVHPRGTTRLSLDGFPGNLIFEWFFENLSRKFKFH